MSAVMDYSRKISVFIDDMDMVTLTRDIFQS